MFSNNRTGQSPDSVLTLPIGFETERLRYRDGERTGEAQSIFWKGKDLRMPPKEDRRRALAGTRLCSARVSSSGCASIRVACAPRSHHSARNGHERSRGGSSLLRPRPPDACPTTWSANGG